MLKYVMFKRFKCAEKTQKQHNHLKTAVNK